MKRFIIDVYKIIYKYSGERLFSVFFTVGYTSALNLLIIYCLIFLLQGLASGISFFLRVFSFPYFFILLFLMLLFNAWLLMPYPVRNREKRKPHTVAPIVIYSLVALMLFLYGHYFERRF